MALSCFHVNLFDKNIFADDHFYNVGIYDVLDDVSGLFYLNDFVDIDVIFQVTADDHGKWYLIFRVYIMVKIIFLFTFLRV